MSSVDLLCLELVACRCGCVCELNYGGPGWAEAHRDLAIKKLPLSNDKTKIRDEYPFASTLEGVGAESVRYVPVIEQNRQRSLMGQLYREEGLSKGIAFKVEVTP